METDWPSFQRVENALSVLACIVVSLLSVEYLKDAPPGELTYRHGNVDKTRMFFWWPFAICYILWYAVHQAGVVLSSPGLPRLRLIQFAVSRFMLPLMLWANGSPVSADLFLAGFLLVMCRTASARGRYSNRANIFLARMGTTALTYHLLRCLPNGLFLFSLSMVTPYTYTICNGLLVIVSTRLVWIPDLDMFVHIVPMCALNAAVHHVWDDYQYYVLEQIHSYVDYRWDQASVGLIKLGKRVVRAVFGAHLAYNVMERAGLTHPTDSCRHTAMKMARTPDRCTYCLCRVANVRTYPCTHMVVCDMCCADYGSKFTSGTTLACFICRTPVESICVYTRYIGTPHEDT